MCFAHRLGVIEDCMNVFRVLPLGVDDKVGRYPGVGVPLLGEYDPARTGLVGADGSLVSVRLARTLGAVATWLYVHRPWFRLA